MLALFMASIAMAATPEYVRVSPKTGEPILFAFTSHPEITMLADGIKISADGASPVSFKFEEVDNIDFPASSGIETLEKSAILVSAYADRVTFSNIPQGSSFKLFSISGQLVKSADSNSDITIYRSDFQKGVYVAVIGNTSFKIVL